jgi:hypothetical protein
MTTLAKAKDHFRHDLLKGFEIHRVSNLLVLFLNYRDQASGVALVDARSKTTRSFKTFDAAVRAAEEIGFEVNVLFSKG